MMQQRPTSRVRPRWCWLSLAAAFCWHIVPASAATAAEVSDAFARQARYLAQQAQSYEHGEGVRRDPEHAAVLYCEAARLGDPEAIYALGWMYANARGVARNDAYAGTLFAMAAFLGNEHAARMMRYTGDYTGAVPDCLHPPPSTVLEYWPADEMIASMSGDRQRIARILVEHAPKFGIQPRLALAIALAESNLDATALSPKNAMGVMQLIPDTAARFNVRKPLDPEDNIKGGLAYLRWLLSYFEGDIALAAAGYNAGEGAVERYRGVPPYPETRRYVERILAFVRNRRHPFDSSIVSPSQVTSASNLSAQKEQD
ncbi:transglycosylase SLT domain-containing protein [Azoarcus sp. L1K30]|uniref:lytic transglycosylase domain-containing protein n=1 Tax=Azoarcus sp. L1K30 TaxID=2820277 RepID=UPI0020136A5A|nr:transglycosylase SLT domain-containing protein [Azoarcus sp. L1K30]